MKVLEPEIEVLSGHKGPFYAVSWSIESVSTSGDCRGFQVIIGLIKDFNMFCLAPN